MKPLFSLCAAAVVLFLPAAVPADTQAQALLKKLTAAIGRVKTLSADLTKTDMDGKALQAKLRLRKPNFALLTLTDAKPNAAPAVLASDGKTVWRFPDLAMNQYRLEPADKAGRGLVQWLDGLPVQTLLGVNQALTDGGIKPENLVHDGIKQWNGQTYDVLRHEYNEEGKRYTAWLYIGQDGLIHRHVGTFYIPNADGTPKTFEVALRNIQINAPLPAARFAYTPPADAVQVVEKPLLAAGTVAPDFTVEARDGSPLRLSAYKGKVVVLDFWATWCLPCVRGMKHTNAVAQKFQKNEVVVLAVNVKDNKADFRAWLAKHPEYKAVRFGIDPAPDGKDIATTLFNATGIPVQYVIGKDGKIVKSIVGYREPTPELADAIQSALAQP
jgi:thiol-disulfide isomerase/thioredoxin